MRTLQKRAISAAAVALLAGLSTVAVAADEPAAEVEVSPITANVSVTSDYRYRGLSQSNFKPAIQGGFDYAHESGLYIGNWNSSISWISDSFPSTGGTRVTAPIEMDFYGGIKKELIGEGFASDLGVLQYYYPTSGLNVSGTYANPNTTEIYAAQNFTFGPATGFVKFSYAVSPIFGTANSSGSYYPDLTVNYDTGVWGLALNAHVGYQYIAGNVQGSKPNVTNSSLYSYTDWKLGVTKDFGGGLSLSAAYIGTDAGKTGGVYNYVSPTGKNLGGSTGVVTLTKTF